MLFSFNVTPQSAIYHLRNNMTRVLFLCLMVYCSYTVYPNPSTTSTSPSCATDADCGWLECECGCSPACTCSCTEYCDVDYDEEESLCRCDCNFWYPSSTTADPTLPTGGDSGASHGLLSLSLIMINILCI